MSHTLPPDAYLLDGPEHHPADMHVRSGYPVWTLVSVWAARGRSDAAVTAEYALDPREWAAAKAYYLAHKVELDARRAENDEPRLPLPGAISLDDLLKETAR